MYQFEIVSISISAIDKDRGEKDRGEEEDVDETPRRETANFWLCGACATSLTLTLEPSLGLRVVPIGSVAAEAEGRSGRAQDC